MKKIVLSMLTIFGLSIFMAVPSFACTSYYAGPECTADGSILYGRTEDTGSCTDKVFKVIDSKNVGPNAVYTDPTGVTSFSAPIKVEKTYRYTICRDSEGTKDGFFGEVGENTEGVSMSGTTSASAARTIRQYDPYTKNGITEENLVDYILCQASTAREGVEILANVIDTVGAGEGNGLFIADQNEVWYFEMLTGHNYCAIKMPKDKAAIIPNCLVIGDVSLNDTENVVASKNLVTLAEENNFYVPAVDKGDINVKLSYTGKGYAASNADRIRGGQYLLTNGQKDNINIYDAEYQDIFFDCSGVTVEKLYELAGYRYENMEFGRAVSRYIGVNSTVECHVLQIRSDMPKELATVEWLSMTSTEFSTFVPFYAALLTDVPESYKKEAYTYDEEAAYWIFRNLRSLCATDRDHFGSVVKSFFKEYMTKLETMQKTVDQQLMNIYKNDRDHLEYYATNLGIAIGNQTVDYAKAVRKDLIQYMAKNDGVYNSSRPFTLSVNAEDMVYNLSMVEPPKTVENKPVEQPSVTQSVKAPDKVVISKLTQKKGKKLKVKLKKNVSAAGYQIAYSKNVNFLKVKTKTVNTKANIKTIKSLKKGRYYVKARAYKLDGTKKVYGSWSSIKVVKIK